MSQPLKKPPEYPTLTQITEPLGLAYGPIISRRLGLSLGVNLLGSEKKICSFDCVYCDLGKTQIRMNDVKHTIKFPASNLVEESVRALLRKQNPADLKAICVAGNGEPTLHPEFSEIMSLLIAARDELTPEVPVVVMTNGTELADRKVLAGLNRVDERILKMDAGNRNLFETVGKPLTRTSVEKIILGRKNLKDVIIQSMFVQGSVNNTTPAAIEEWIEVMSLLNPKLVHITTFDKTPAYPGLIRVTEQDLYAISQKLKRATGIKSIVAA